MPDDNWFHLAPEAARIVALTLGEGKPEGWIEALDGQDRLPSGG